MSEEKPSIIELATKCSQLRKDGHPDEVIILTGDIIGNLDRYKVTDGIDRIYCTRGAAFRQLGDDAEALRCALKSLEINSDFKYAFNLAGAAAIGLGKSEGAEDYFNEARKRGLNHKHIEMLKRQATKRLANQQKPTRELSRAKVIHAYEEYGFEPFDLFEVPYSKYEEHFYRDEMYQEVDSFSEMWELANEDGWFYGDN